MLKNLQRVFVGLLLLGAAIWLYGCFMPAFIEGKSINDLHALIYHTDPDDAGKSPPTGGSKVDYRKAYYAAEEAWRTSRNAWLDVGSGVAISSMTVLLYLRAGRVQTRARFRRLKTVGKTGFLIWLNVGWAILLASLYWYYYYRSFRGDFPPFADSLGIPLYYGQAALLGGWLISNALFLLALWPAQLPALLFSKFKRNTLLAALIDALLGLVVLLTGLYAILTIIDGDHLTIPVMLLFVYLLLVLRAGYVQKINRKP